MATRVRAAAAQAWSALGRIPPLAILIAAGALIVAYAFPGYMNFDAAEQLAQARGRVYDDWHPPMMARYWHYLEKVMRGSMPLLLIQTTLSIAGVNSLFRRRFQPRTAAWMTTAILVFPPVLAPMGPVWKDAQMVGFLLAGTMLMLRSSPRSRILGAALFFLAAGVRDNAALALPPLLLLAVGSWNIRKKLVVCGVAFGAFVVIAGGARLANKQLADRQAYAWSQANAIHDITGMICFTDPMTDAEVRDQLAGIPLRVGADLQKELCARYNPRWWLGLALDAAGVFSAEPDEAERQARGDAYARLVRRDPGAFLEHRWRVTREFLGLGDAVPDEPVCQTFVGAPYQAKKLGINDRHSVLQRVVGRVLERCATTLMFRPWAYMLVGLILFGWAIYRRDGLVMALLGSGFMYELSFVLGAAGAPFRYSHWMILCVCLATLLVFGERLRSGFKSRVVSH